MSMSMNMSNVIECDEETMIEMANLAMLEKKWAINSGERGEITMSAVEMKALYPEDFKLLTGSKRIADECSALVVNLRSLPEEERFVFLRELSELNSRLHQKVRVYATGNVFARLEKLEKVVGLG